MRLKQLNTLTASQDSPNVCSEEDTKQSDGEAPVILEHGEMRIIHSLLLLLGPHWPEVVITV